MKTTVYKQNKFKNKNIIKILIGLAAGALLGFTFGFLAGCSSGSCPLTSNPIISTLGGAVFGLLFALNFIDNKKNKIDTDNENE